MSEDIEALRKDAARLDWIDAFHGIDDRCPLRVVHKETGFVLDDLRAAIDAAMSVQQAEPAGRE